MRHDSGRFKRLLPSPWFQVALVVAGGAIYSLALVRRGLSPSDVETLDGARRLSTHLPGSAPPQTLATDHPFVEWLLAAIHGLTGTPLETIWVLGTAAAAAAALPAVWQLVSPIRRPGARWCALLSFAAAPTVVAASSASLPAALALAVWSWLLVGLTAVRRGPFERLLEWTGWGVMLFAWPPALVWLGLWLLVELTMSDRSSIALGDLAIPLGAAGSMTLILPGFHSSDIATAWETYLQHVLTHREGPFWFAGYLYSEARPPVWAGIELFVWSWPAAVVVAGFVGWGLTWWVSSRSLTDRTLTRRRQRCARLVAWCLPSLWLVPWLTRHAAWGSIDISLMAAPVIALAVGLAVDHLEDAIDRLEVGPARLNWTVFLAAAVVVASSLAGSIRSHPMQGSYYNGALGGLPAAVHRGHRLSRDDVLPVDLVDRLPRDTQVFAVGAEERLERYAAFNWLAPGRLADGPGSADVVLRPLEPFGPGDKAGPDLMFDTTGGFELFEVDGFPVWLVSHESPTE